MIVFLRAYFSQSKESVEEHHTAARGEKLTDEQDGEFDRSGQRCFHCERIIRAVRHAAALTFKCSKVK